MNRSKKTKIINTTIAVMTIACFVIPFFQVKLVLGAIAGILIFYSTHGMRARKREEEVIMLSEDEVRYSTRKKEEPVKTAEPAKPAKSAPTREAVKETAETNSGAAGVADKGTAGVADKAREKSKPSAYTL